MCIHLQAQPGCTDPQAINYDDAAQENDGSCMYANTNYQLQHIANLPPALQETSGLAYDKKKLLTINDAGNTAELFHFDTLDGSVIQSWHIREKLNTDWEDLAQDEQFLYIGDFGNNNGNRQDLRILRIDKTQLIEDTLNVDTIHFHFSDQTDFTPNSNNNNFDCEAFFALGDSLYLFSKNWVDRKTRQYVLPAIPGEQTAELRDSFDVNGLITGAAIDDDGVVALLGYTEISTFLWLLFDYQNTRFFSGNKRPINLGTPLSNSQTEGIIFNREGEGFISAEALSVLGLNLPQRFFRFTTRQWTDLQVNSVDIVKQLQLTVYPNPFLEKINLEIQGQEEITATVLLYDSLGNLVKNINWNGAKTEITTTDLNSGIYWLLIKNEKGLFRQKLVKQ